MLSKSDRKLVCILSAMKIKMRRFKHSIYNWEKKKLKKDIICLFKLYQIISKKRKPRSQWVRYIFREERRFSQGVSDNLIVELEKYDRRSYMNYLRVTPEIFQELLDIVGPKIVKNYFIREPISANTRLQIVLRYLATGNCMKSLAYDFRLGVSTVCSIINETCDAIWDALSKEVFINPNADDWKKVARGFEEKWNFDHCVGAIDGRHMVIKYRIFTK